MLFCLLKYSSFLTNLPFSLRIHLEKTYSYFMIHIKTFLLWDYTLCIQVDDLWFVSIFYFGNICNIVLITFYSNDLLTSLSPSLTVCPWEQTAFHIYLFIPSTFHSVWHILWLNKCFVEFNCHKLSQRLCTYLKLCPLPKISLGCESYPERT